MKDYKVSINDYMDYLKILQKSIFKILPLYEESNKYIADYIEDTIDKVIYVKEIIEPLSNGSWYIEILSNLKKLRILVEVEGQHKKIRKTIFESTNLIESYIKDTRERK